MQYEPALLCTAKKLDRDALIAVFDQYASAVYNYAYRWCHDAVEADKIVGDTFFTLLEQLSAGKGPVVNLRSYIFQVAYHRVADPVRHNNHLTGLKSVSEVHLGFLASSTNGQSDELVLMKNLLYAMNNDLSEIQRHVIILRFLEGFSVSETAMIVGKGVNHVKVIQSRGMSRLRKSLGHQFDHSIPG